MPQSRFKYLVLIIFLGSVVLIVFLQYNSGNSIRNLITDNQSLLNELQIKSQLQRFQTDIIFGESALRDLVTSEDPEHILEADKDLKRIQTEFAEIDRTIRSTSEPQLLNSLSFLVTEKLENSNQVIKILYEEGKDSALAFIRTLRGRIIRDSIIQTIGLINESRQKALSNISASVNKNGSNAKSWGIILAIVACLASLVTLWYLVVQGQRQQKLIRTLDTSERKLKEASKIQEQFVANISHEIRTPMNAILGFAGLLQKTSLDKNQHEYVRSIRSSAENLLTIINDILDLSRIESGMMHIERLPFNVRELVDSLATMMNVKAKSRNLYLTTEIDQSIPQILKGDAVRLTQILINLLSNALKFTHDGGVSIKAEFADKKDEMVSVRFVISDTGIGIEPTKQKTIFERFHQAQPETTRRYGGTGLGLSIVKQLVEIQNGTISVDSAPGEGSVFTVVLPYQISNEAETTGVRLSPVLVAGPVLNNIKILVAEDNLMNQKLLKHLLAQWQINFDIVNNGAEAVKVLEHRPEDYALVLMDIQMPEMDGYAATERMRHDLDLRIPIIAMTAHALAGEKEKCLGAGMDDYISKPINEEELYKLINKYVQGNSPQDRSVIDLEYLKIISKGDEVFEKNMIRSFSIQMPEELNRLKSSILERDYEQIGSIAHNMKSTLAYMGLRQLTPLLQQIEQECKKQNGITRINDNFTLISATCQLAITEAKELIS